MNVLLVTPVGATDVLVNVTTVLAEFGSFVKADAFMEATLSPKVILVKPLHPEKKSPTLVTLSPMTSS